jgi:hypothetical protein
MGERGKEGGRKVERKGLDVLPHSIHLTIWTRSGF